MVTQASDLINLAESYTQCDLEEPLSEIDQFDAELSRFDLYSNEDQQVLAQSQLENKRQFSCQIGIRSFTRM